MTIKISNVPAEVFAAALDNERIDRPAALSDCETTYRAETTRRAYTSGGIERAISDYLTLRGPFAEDGGEFAGLSGYTLA